MHLQNTQVMVNFFVCVFPLSPYAALISGILIIAWPHGRLSSLGEEAETGEGRWEVHQHPATSHLSCHPCYASHGIPLEASRRQKAGCSLLSHTNSLHSQSVLIWMWVNKRVSLEICISPLTFIQVICTSVKKWRCRVRNLRSQKCLQLQSPKTNLHSIVCTGLCM